VSYKGYWGTWVALLALTFLMLFVGGGSTAGLILLGLLLAAMAVKATIICANFMHLRFERGSLVWMVGLGILFTALALFAGIAVDGARILRLSQ